MTAVNPSFQPQKPAPLAYLPGPHKPGHNRPKGLWDWGWQVFYAILAVVTIASGSAMAILGVFAIFGIFWVEWMARCENRRAVHIAIAVMWGIIALMTMRNNRYEAGVAARKQTHPHHYGGPGADGKWNALDYGDR